MNKYSDFYKIPNLFTVYITHRKADEPERNGFIKCLTRPNEDDKKDQICYSLLYVYVLKICTVYMQAQNMSWIAR